MIKLYFKKVLFTIGFLTNYILLLFILAFAWHLAFGYIFSEIVKTLILAAMTLILNFVIVCKIRCINLDHKTDMMPISFWENFFRIFKSKDSIVHAFAFASIVLLFFVSVGVAEKTPILPLVIGTIVLFFVWCFIFLIVNTLLWCIAYGLVVRKNTKR